MFFPGRDEKECKKFDSRIMKQFVNEKDPELREELEEITWAFKILFKQDDAQSKALLKKHETKYMKQRQWVKLLKDFLDEDDISDCS